MDSSAVAVTFEVADCLALILAAMESSSTTYVGSLMMGPGLTRGFCGDLTIGSCGNATIIQVGFDASALGSWNRTLGTCGWDVTVSSCAGALATLGSWRWSCCCIWNLFPGLSCWSICSSVCICLESVEFLMPCKAEVKSRSALIIMSAGVTSGCVMYLCLKNSVSVTHFACVFLTKTKWHL